MDAERIKHWQNACIIQGWMMGTQAPDLLMAEIKRIVDFFSPDTKIPMKQLLENPARGGAMKFVKHKEVPAAPPAPAQPPLTPPPSTPRNLSDEEKRIIVQMHERNDTWDQVAASLPHRHRNTLFQFYYRSKKDGTLLQYRHPKIPNAPIRIITVSPAVVETTPSPVISADRLIDKHNEFLGDREPGQPLADDDWPNIQAMIRSGIGVTPIAKQFGVKPSLLDAFIEKHLLEEARDQDSRRRGPYKAKKWDSDARP